MRDRGIHFAPDGRNERELLWDDPYRTPGKPHKRVVARLQDHDLEAANDHFPTPEMKAYYFANAIEAVACWPRVLAGTMAQERFHDRIKRTMDAIRTVLELREERDDDGRSD